MNPKIKLRPLGVRFCAARFVKLALALTALLLAAGCADLTLPAASEPKQEVKPEQSTADLSADAEGFWKAGNQPLSELLYARLLERGDLSEPERAQALDRLASSAYGAKHYRQAKIALDRRAAADKSVLGTWQWHELYLKTLVALNRADLLEAHQGWIMTHTELPYELRCRAMVAFSAYAAQSGDAARGLNLLAELHRQAPDAASRARMESIYTESLSDLPEDQLATLARLTGTIGPKAATVFPHALVQREAARRSQRLGSSLAPLAAPQAANSQVSSMQAASAQIAGPQISGTAAALAAPPLLSTSQAAGPGATGPVSASPVAAGVLLAQNATRKQTASDQPASLLPRQTDGVTNLALVLPLTGRFASTGQKVLRGAGAAQKRLAAQGRKVEIKVINAESPDWREQLAALPANVSIVGGPLLNADGMRSLQASGALAKRAVFAFQPDLGNIQEGKQAWRFYPSLQDQARALLDLTADGLGIRSVAVLAPRNRYGQRMAEVFQTEAKARGLRVAANETYPPDDHPRWMQSVSHLLRVPDGFRHNKNTPLPMPEFGAVFMPEDWTQAEMLASNFYFFEGQHLLFLGSDLWSVGLDNAKDIDDTYFQHAACPGAWWPETNGGRALQAVLDEQSLGQADIWVAIGYDFVRLASRLNLSADWNPAEVNARLAALKDLDYSMAPIVWSADGHARQKLYVFTPRKEGKALVDTATMRESIQKAKDRREKRIGTAREMQKNKKSGATGSLTRDTQN